MADARRDGILFVLAAPSGTGKSTLARRLVREVPDLAFSVSFTTRPPRAEERPGTDYHFVDRATFERMRGEEGFVESAEVYGELYGTALGQTREVVSAGRDLVLDIDVQGARQVRRGPIDTVLTMVLPPDYDTLHRRLCERGSEDDAQRARRLAAARAEVAGFAEFDYLVVNADLQQTVLDLAAIVRAERRRTARCADQARRILDSFPA